MQEEKKQRNIIEQQYETYINLFESYHNKCTSIIKYMFIDVHNQRKCVEARDKDLNKFIKKNFGKVFIINGKSNIIKNFQMTEKMLLDDITFEFYDSYETNSPESYIEYLESNSNLTFEDWCYLKTLEKILCEIKNKNYDKCLILDNNACLNTNMYNELKFNKEIYKKWDMIIFNNAEHIGNLQTFGIKNNAYDSLLNKVKLALETNNKNIILNLDNLIKIPNIIKSDITEEDIIQFRAKDRETYQKILEENIKKRDNLDKQQENYEKIFKQYDDALKNMKKNKYSNNYSYLFNGKKYNISMSYENMLNNFKNYYEYLENKKIALVGPSPSIRKTKNGEEIDSNYDVIIKMNNAIFNNSEFEYSGKRIDVLYTLSVAQDLNQRELDPKYNCFQEFFFEKIKELNIKYVILSMDMYSLCHNNWLSLHIMRMSESYNIYNIPILFLEHNIVENHINKCKKIPSAGFGAIMNLVQYPIKEIFIKGFTFFKDGHSNSYIGDEWQKKIEKTNAETKNNLTEEKKEKIIHSLVSNSFVNLSPHHFDYEYKKTIEFSKKYSNIKFDESIKYLYN
jgi:hypothetical protein